MDSANAALFKQEWVQQKQLTSSLPHHHQLLKGCAICWSDILSPYADIAYQEAVPWNWHCGRKCRMTSTTILCFTGLKKNRHSLCTACDVHHFGNCSKIKIGELQKIQQLIRNCIWFKIRLCGLSDPKYRRRANTATWKNECRVTTAYASEAIGLSVCLSQCVSPSVCGFRPTSMTYMVDCDRFCIICLVMSAVHTLLTEGGDRQTARDRNTLAYTYKTSVFYNDDDDDKEDF